MIDTFNEDRVFILKRTPYREQRYLLDIFHSERGYFRASAKITKNSIYRATNSLALFQELLITGSRKRDLATIWHSEPHRIFRLTGQMQITAYYLNELLLTYLPADDPAKPVYNSYTQALRVPSIRTYRSMEFELLCHLGLDPEIVGNGDHYLLTFEHSIPMLHAANNGYDVELVNALRTRDIDGVTNHPQAKALFQQIFHHQRPLPNRTREVTRVLSKMTSSSK